MPAEQRLQKVLAAAGIGSRRRCEELIEAGRISVDGQVVTRPGTTVDPNSVEIRFDGERIRTQRKVYWWVNKPSGVLCTTRDPQGRPTVLDLLPPLAERVYPVGRLDDASTGLLLLTNDGALADRLTHPRYGVPKTYEVLVAGKVTGPELAKLRQGIWLAEGKARPRQIVRLGVRGKATRLRLVLAEGRNREIRRLLAKLDHKVMALSRTAIGPIQIRRLKGGRARLVSAEELRRLKELAFGNEGPARRRPGKKLR